MAKFKTYKRTQTVKARKVGKDGESVVTSAGVQRVASGDYVVQDENGDRVLTSDEFEAQGWKTPTTSKSTSKPAAKSEPAPKDKPLTPAERIAAAKAAKAAKSAGGSAIKP